jgi:RNA polymerase sigma-70 factor (ECF subfamily)
LDDARTRKRADELMRAHGEYLRGLARRLCRRHFDPDDLVQDLLEKTVRSPDAIAAAANERAWLSRVMQNLFIDRVRRTRSRREEPITAEPAATVSDAPPWWDSLTGEQVRAQLAHLPEDQRATFELFAFEHLSYDEIAARMNIAKSTVGTRILRARGKLRELLTGEYGHD